MRIRSKYNWYKGGKKSTKFFLNLEKTHSSQGAVCSILKNKIEVKSQSEIDNEFHKFYKNVFKGNLNIPKEAIFLFLENINLLTLTMNRLLNVKVLLVKPNSFLLPTIYANRLIMISMTMR